MTTIETSLARLNEDEFRNLQNRWSRGIDWMVQKVGTQWKVADIFGAFPLFKTKTAAYNAASNLFLAEATNRTIKNQTEHEN